MPNSKRFLIYTTCSFLFVLYFVTMLQFPAPQVKADGSIQQPAHIFGAFTTNDCAKVNASGFIVSNGASCAAAVTTNNINPFSGSGLPFTPPNAAGFTNLNFSTGDTLTTTTDGGEILTQDRGNTTTIMGRMVALPAAPYSVTACFLSDSLYTSASFGLTLYDGTKLEAAVGGLGASSGALVIADFNTVTSSASQVDGATMAAQPTAGFLCQRVTDDATNRKWFFSLDGGGSWMRQNATSFSRANNSFLVPTQAGYIVQHTNGNLPANIHAYHFLISTNSCTGDFTQVGLTC